MSVRRFADPVTDVFANRVLINFCPDRAPAVKSLFVLRIGGMLRTGLMDQNPAPAPLLAYRYVVLILNPVLEHQW